MNQHHKYYFDHPDKWEALRLHSIDKEVDFIHHIFSTYSKINYVLDIGCGTGIHCEKLQKLGYKMHGVDLNPNMINFAKKKHPTAKYHLGNMQQLKKLRFPFKFDGVLCLCTTFCYNISNKKISSVLQDINSLMSIGGIFIVEVFNPISFFEKNTFDGSFFLEDHEAYKKLNLLVDVKHTIDEKRQIVHETKRVSDLNSLRLLKEDRTEFRMYFPQELCYFLQQHGFEVKEQYGRYDLNYLRLDRTRLITVAQKVT